MARLKMCSHFSCTKIIEDNERYCNTHKKRYAARQKVRYKDYQRRRLEDHNEAKTQAFYHSDEWIRAKEVAKLSTFHIDIFHYYLIGKIIEGETVHHIIELKEDWSRRSDVSNLLYLSNKNHAKIHSKYNSCIEDKKRIQKMLLELKKRFDEEFKTPAG